MKSIRSFSKVRIMESSALAQPSDLNVNKQGQALRRKGKITRQRFLDETFALLHNVTLEEVTVPNIAAQVGLSTATFYLYFSDIDELYLELAERAGNDFHVLLELVETPWPLTKIYEHAIGFVTAFLSIVRRHRPVIHLRNARADRCDKRFDNMRIKSARPLIEALGRQLHRHEGTVKTHEVDFSEAIGATLFTGLERLSIRISGQNERTEDTEILIQAQAQVITDSISAAARGRRRGYENLPGRK